jgi:hypothetical protein
MSGLSVHHNDGYVLCQRDDLVRNTSQDKLLDP